MSGRLAKLYVAIARGRYQYRAPGQRRQRAREVWIGSEKREIFRDAKRFTLAQLQPGARVELRADRARGPIIERVRLAKSWISGRHTWINDFET